MEKNDTYYVKNWGKKDKAMKCLLDLLARGKKINIKAIVEQFGVSENWLKETYKFIR